MGGGHMVIKNTVREHDPPSYEGTPYVKKKFLENFQEMSIFVKWRFQRQLKEGYQILMII
jgi:hypothetical protein